MNQGYKCISGDSHLEITPEAWVHRVPAKYRDRVPKIVKTIHGGDAWLVEGNPMRPMGIELCGNGYDKIDIIRSYEGAYGVGSPQQRLDEQDQDGVDAEILYSGLGGPKLLRGIKSDEVYTVMLRAYNDFLAEDYCSVDRDRLIGMGLIPETGVRSAIAEMERCAQMGLKGVVLNSFPAGNSIPTPEDDEFWSAALSLNMPITVHINMAFVSAAFASEGGRSFKFPRSMEEVDHAAVDMVRAMASHGLRGGLNAVQLTMAGVFERFPKLKMYFAENEAGWIPHFLQILDTRYERHKMWMENRLGMTPLKRKPSEYVLENCYWGFMFNPIGVELRHKIGVDHIIWGSDFPHSATDWPFSKDVLAANFAGVPEDEVYKMTVSNVVDYFHLNPGPASRSEQKELAGRI